MSRIRSAGSRLAAFFRGREGDDTIIGGDAEVIGHPGERGP